MLIDLMKKVMIEYLPTYKNDGEVRLSSDERTELEITMSEIASIIDNLMNNGDYYVKARTATGRIADVPWIGIHNRFVNSEAKTGVYIAILFHVDGKGVSISIQHGTDHISLSKLSDLVDKIQTDFDTPKTFVKSPLNLRPHPIPNRLKDNSVRPAKYEKANILGKSYMIDELNDNFITDLRILLKEYEQWCNQVTRAIHLDDEEYQIQHLDYDLVDSDFNPPKERKSPLDREVKVGALPPRDPKQGEIALVKADWKCEVDPTHETFLRPNGKRYMEKHHLIPMEYYFKFDLSIDHHSNIYSLCPTCHRKIHYGTDEDKKEMIKLLFNKRLDTFRENYNLRQVNVLYEMYRI